MIRPGAGAALVLLLTLAAGCDRMVTPQPAPVYAGWEEGLTLGYEDPTLEPAKRLEQRQQVRVQESRPGPNGLLVTKAFTSLTGQVQAQMLVKDGGTRILAGPPGGIELLPEGFPDRVDRWEARGVYHWVVGRAAAQLPGVRLPGPEAAVGVWVESLPLDRPGPRTRTLYLPGVGEAETRTWAQGRWVTTNILVTRGFTDLPAAATTPGSQP